jgi:transposase
VTQLPGGSLVARCWVGARGRSRNAGRRRPQARPPNAEALRLRAVEQVARGVPAAEVGAGLAALGLHRRTIYTWLAKERTEGREALRAKPVPGRPRKLTDAQLGELTALIAESHPREHGFAVALWTREIVRQLIAARFGVDLTVASIGRTLHDLSFSAQRPLYRAEQADPVAVTR